MEKQGRMSFLVGYLLGALEEAFSVRVEDTIVVLKDGTQHTKLVVRVLPSGVKFPRYRDMAFRLEINITPLAET